MKATILDTKTGLRQTVEGPRSFEWAENNYSCDCNRNPWHASTGKPDGICEGCERFLVVAAEMNDPEDYEYTLMELNACYPPELLKAHVIGQNVPADFAGVRDGKIQPVVGDGEKQ